MSLDKKYDDKILRFRNLRFLSASDWEKFDCSTQHFKDTTVNNDGNGEDGGVDAGGARKKKKKCKVRQQQIDKEISLTPKSTFRSWFRMPMYKVEELAARFVTEKVITLSHHCRSEEQLQKKAELLVMGSLPILGGIYTTFRQTPTLTNIGFTEHTIFFLKFVHLLWRICDEYIFLPKDEGQL